MLADVKTYAIEIMKVEAVEFVYMYVCNLSFIWVLVKEYQVCEVVCFTISITVGGCFQLLMFESSTFGKHVISLGLY